MRKHSLRISPCVARVAIVAALLVAPSMALAHTGGPLDSDGCHADHRTGTYHCHRGPAAGYTFPNRNAMLEAVRSGNFPEKTVEKDGFFSKLWPFGEHHEEEAPAADAAGAAAAPAPGPGSASAAQAPAPASTGAAKTGAGPGTEPVPAKQREFEQRLKVLQGLYEMGLITKDEYEAKRKAVLDQL